MTSSTLVCLKRDLSSLWLQSALKVLSRCWQLRGCDTTYIALSSSKSQDQFHADPANYICTMRSLSSCCCSLDDLSLQPSQGLSGELVSFTRPNWSNKAKKQPRSFQAQRSVLSLSNGKPETLKGLCHYPEMYNRLLLYRYIWHFFPVVFHSFLRGISL